jgi:hypothetical protein
MLSLLPSSPFLVIIFILIMIIYGAKGNVLTLGKIEERYCPTCDKNKYFSITE